METSVQTGYVKLQILMVYFLQLDAHEMQDHAYYLEQSSHPKCKKKAYILKQHANYAFDTVASIIQN